MKTIIIIPAYNEEKTIGDVVKNSVKYVDKVVVIDDCSTDKTAEIAEKSGAVVLRHIVNRGLGGALNTGIKKAIAMGAGAIITIDADGQHDTAKIPELISPIKNNYADFVVGSRFLQKQEMPYFRIVANKFGNLATFVLWQARSTDTQSGMRAMTAQAAQKINIQSNGMEVSSEFIKEIKKNNLRYTEIPIQAIYTDYSMSKGQNFFHGIKTLAKLLLLKFIK